VPFEIVETRKGEGLLADGGRVHKKLGEIETPRRDQVEGKN
jgi:hypothetical protein